MLKKRLYFPALGLLLAALSCNLPSANQGPDAAFTAVAQTVEAQVTLSAQTQAAGGAVTSTPTLTTLPTTAASATPSATSLPATNTPLPCNQATFVNDVTYPDDTHVTTGQSFTKIWRFKNIGTCTWTSSYQLVFDHGDQMGGPATQPLTGGTVPPGATVDVSVNLVAPGTQGTYKGFWRFRDPSSVLFGLSTGSFWVQIKAVSPAPTSTSTLPPAAIAATVDVPIVPGESGSVRSDGSVLGATNVGDVESNASSQAFASFDISGIPAGVTISTVRFSFINYDTLGDPFGGLGCLRLYQHSYGSVDAGDFTGGSPLNALGRWCSAAELSTVDTGPSASSMTAAIQSSLGSSRIRFRFQFNDTATDSDGVADMVRFGNIKLIVSYHSP